MAGSGLQILSIVVTVWCLINAFRPIKRLGLKSRKSAFKWFLFTLAACLIIIDVERAPPRPAEVAASADQQSGSDTNTTDSVLAVAQDEDKRAAWIAKGQDAVVAKLKDPGSAQFRNAFFHLAKSKGQYTPISCGEVNSKNGFGGYSGYQRYISAGSPDLTFLEEEMPEFEKAWQQLCVD